MFKAVTVKICSSGAVAIPSITPVVVLNTRLSGSEGTIENDETRLVMTGMSLKGVKMTSVSVA